MYMVKFYQLANLIHHNLLDKKFHFTMSTSKKTKIGQNRGWKHREQKLTPSTKYNQIDIYGVTSHFLRYLRNLFMQK